MSKSARNTIELFATDAEVQRQVMGIRTDSTPRELPKPIDNALYQFLALMAPPGEFAELDSSWKAGGKGYAEYKKALLEYFHATFDKARRRREELRGDPAEVERFSSTALTVLARSRPQSWRRFAWRRAFVSNCSES